MERLIDDPFIALDTVHTRLNELLLDMDQMLGTNLSKNGGVSPRVDISQDKESLFYMMELPGIGLEDIKITTSTGMLTIYGEKRREESKQSHKHRSYERSFGTFTRTFSLPEGVNANMIQAELDNGVLEIRIPLPEKAIVNVKEIKVSTGSKLLKSTKTNDYQAVVS